MRARTTQDSKKLCSLRFLFYGGFHLLIALIQIYFYLWLLSDSCEMSCWLWSSLVIGWLWLMIHVGGSTVRLPIAWPTWGTLTPWIVLQRRVLLPTLLHKPSSLYLVRGGWEGCGSAGLNIHIFSLWISEAARPWGKDIWANKGCCPVLNKWAYNLLRTWGLILRELRERRRENEVRKYGDWTPHTTFHFPLHLSVSNTKGQISGWFPHFLPYSSLTSGVVSVCLCMNLRLNAVILTPIETTGTKGL